MEFKNHGTSTTYVYGCRCEACRSAHGESTKLRRKKKRLSYKHHSKWEELPNIIAECKSVREILKKLELHASGGNYFTCKKRIREFGLDTSHFTGKRSNLGKNHGRADPFSSDKVIGNSEISRATLRRCIIRERLLEEKCQVCGITEWHGKSLSLRLDHINGINDDNRLENLRFLCPNCDSQNDTFCGRNRGRQGNNI